MLFYKVGKVHDYLIFAERHCTYLVHNSFLDMCITIFLFYLPKFSNIFLQLPNVVYILQNVIQKIIVNKLINMINK